MATLCWCYLRIFSELCISKYQAHYELNLVCYKYQDMDMMHLVGLASPKLL